MNVNKTQLGATLGAVTMFAMLAFFGVGFALLIESGGTEPVLWYVGTISCSWIATDIIKNKIDFDRLEEWAVSQPWIETEDGSSD